MHADRSEKKSERMEVRLGYSEKQAFVEACDTQGDTPSSALRRFISGYTRRADGELISEANRRILRRYGLRVGLATVLGIGVISWLVFNTTHSPNRFLTQAGFAALDIDKDGALDVEELGPQGEHLLRVLNIDGVPGVQKREAVAKGRMSYMIGEGVTLDQKEMDVTSKTENILTPETLVEFDLLDLDNVSIFMRQGESGAYKPDRMVIWESEATRPKLVFGNADVSIK